MTSEKNTATVLSLVVTALLTLACSALLFTLDDSAVRVGMQERAGYYRGEFVDDRGRPVAWSIGNGGRTSRRYLTPGLASLLGYSGPAGHWQGLEAKYDSFLSARNARADWRTFFLHLRGQAAQGGRVRLTLDSHLQQVAQQALHGVRGAIVALDPRTGDVRAMASSPYCAPATLSTASGYANCSSAPDRPLLDRAITRPVPPGSAFKIVTLSAAIDTGAFNLSSLFSGVDAFGPSPYFDNSLYPSNVTRADLTVLTLAQALAFSDNFAFAHIGLTLGSSTLLRYAHRYYVGRRIPFVVPVARSTVANDHPHPSLSELAQSSFGGAVDRVTPLQMAMIAETVADRGTLMAPRLVEGLQSANGRTRTLAPPRSLGRVMSAGAAGQVAAGMKFVVDHGSGFNAQISRIDVAGKTGTAESGQDKPNAWFICFAPIHHPVIAVAVLHEDSGEGFQYAAPLARRILIAALREHGYRVQ